MTSTRRVLVVLVAVLAALTVGVLWEVLGTVFFAITLVYVAGPLYRGLVDRGLAPWWASAVTTLVVFGSALALFVPFVQVLYRRRADIVEALRSLPETIVFGFAGVEFELVTGDALAAVITLLRRGAIDVAEAAPVLGLKASLLAIVVFALLIRKEAASGAILAAIPRRHRPIVRRLDERLRETLLAIYVLQAATALGTFAIAFPLFALLGYRFSLVLAVFAGLLQFLPIVGPSVVVGALVVGELAAGDVVGAVLVGVLGWLLVAVLPDVLIRPRLAEATARMPGSLYFIGFIGGLLTLGPVGIIAGPVVVALLQEALAMLAAETDVAGDLVESD